MAIDKKLIFWKKQSTFNAPSSITDTTGSVMWYSIVFFKDTGQIWTNGTYYNCGIWGTPQTNYVPLTIGGTSYNLSRDGHTHNYLPLSGGTITAPSEVILSLNTSAPNQRLYLQKDGIPTGQFGYSSTNGLYIFNHITNTSFLLGNDSNPYFSTNGSFSTTYKIWHAGNDGAGSGLDADLLDGIQASGFTRSDQDPIVDLNTVNGSGIMCNSYDVNATLARNYPIAQAGTLFYGTAAYSSANQIYGSYSSNRWFARGGGSGINSKTSWKEFAFISDLGAYLPLSGGTLTGPVMKDKELLHLAYLNLGSGTTTGIIDIKLPNVNWMGDMYVDFYNYSVGLGGTLRCQIYTYYGSSTGFAGANSVSWTGGTPPFTQVRYVTVGTDNYAERHILIGTTSSTWSFGTVWISRAVQMGSIGSWSPTLVPTISLITVEPTILVTSLNFSDFYTHKSNLANSALKVSSTLTRGNYLTGNNFDGSSATTWAVDATSTSIASKIVARDGSGNFSANIITASSFIKSGGTSSQFLKADGTVDSNAYLPLTGGILTRYLDINTPNTGGSSFLRFKRNGVNVGYVGDGASGANTKIELSNYISGKSLSLGNDGILRYGGNVVWHQGNDGTNSGLDADTLDTFHAKVNGGGGEAWGYIPVVAADGTMQVGRYLDFNHSSGIGADYNARLHTNGVTDGELYINSNRIWHAGNFNPSNYLPLTGGTLTNPSYGGQLTIDRSLAGGSAIILYKNSVDGWTKAMGVDHLGRPVFEGSVMWHAGNLNLSTYFTYRGSFTSSSNMNDVTDMGMWLNTTGNGSGNNNFPAQYGYIQTFSRGVENYSRWQMSVDNTADNIHIRAEWAGTWGGWKKLWHSANDGSGSGLDADLLDGVNGDSFLRNDMGIISSASQLIPNGLQHMSTGSHDLGGDLPSTIEGTIANFNGFSKSSNALGFKLLVPASVGTGLYYQSFYNSYRGWTKVYDTKNSNLTTIDWAAKNLSVANNIVFTSGASSNLINGVNTLSLGAGGVNGVLNVTNANVATFKELLLAEGVRIHSNAGAGLGISLFAEPALNPNYGLMFAQTVYKGTHGAVNGDWATYFTMSPDAGRGWIFTNSPTTTGGNVASISSSGNMSLNGYLQVQGGANPAIKSLSSSSEIYMGSNLYYKSVSGIKEFIMTSRIYNINPTTPTYSTYNPVPVILWHGRITITSSSVSALTYNYGAISLTGTRLGTGTARLDMVAQYGAELPSSSSDYIVVGCGLGTANTTGSCAYFTIPDTYKYGNNFRIVISDDSTANDGYVELMIIRPIRADLRAN